MRATSPSHRPPFSPSLFFPKRFAHQQCSAHRQSPAVVPTSVSHSLLTMPACPAMPDARITLSQIWFAFPMFYPSRMLWGSSKLLSPCSHGFLSPWQVGCPHGDASLHLCLSRAQSAAAAPLQSTELSVGSRRTCLQQGSAPRPAPRPVCGFCCSG